MLTSTSALAAGREPVVLRGYGPEDAAYAQPAPQRESRTNLGGGFIEMLVRGGQDSGGRVARYNSPDDQAGLRRAPVHAAQPSYEPAYAEPLYAPAPQGYRQQAAFAPQPGPQAGVRRMVDPAYLRQEVEYRGPHAPGTIVVDTPNKFLYLVQGNGRALRYGIGVGRPGFEWAGVKTVTRKAEWPDWRPPAEMLKRRPDLPSFMPGGPENPLGARALYLGSSLYRIHGTNEPHTIGQNVSSGCIRMMNEDAVDLYPRVRVGTRVIVI
ncbi:MAG: L,D-transpeptidase [Beijerinckiaceae bacterium]|nr:L,D-transpeptidase [Beijerinckiaceae bacterium]